jgi:pyruvate dehydrogenase kinase 2/3/4
MSLSSALQASLKHDATEIIKRWSLRSLADHGIEGVTASNSKLILSEATKRLAHQHEACVRILEIVKEIKSRQDNILNSEAAFVCQRAISNLESLRYVHADTYKLGREIVGNQNIWNRFSKSDKHLLHSTAEQLRSRHARSIETMVQIVSDIRNIDGDETQVDSHVDEFLQGRLGVQLLCDHYVRLYKGSPNGGVSVNCLLADAISDAVTEASHMCDAHLQIFPETLLPEPGLRLTIVRPWIHHALVELLKNAMAASVAKANRDSKNEVDPVRINLGEDDEMILIDIVDEGTGIEQEFEEVFLLGHSTAVKRWDRLDEQQSYAAVRSPLSSLGVGLPTSRWMIEYFRGSLELWNNKDISTGPSKGCTSRLRLYRDPNILEQEPRIRR